MKKEKIKWLITGGCGFIGRNLVNHLTNEGNHFIRILDNLSVGSRNDLSTVCNFVETNVAQLESSLFSETELVVGDILDADLAVNASKGMDVIVHLAANTGVAPSVENPRMDCENNVIGTLNMLEAARINGNKRFVFASSGAPAGEIEPPIHEEIAPHPVSPYGASKLSGEGYCSAYFHTFGIQTVCLRFGNVYGPLSSHKDSVVAKFIKHIMDGKPLEIYGDGTQTRDFIFAGDLIKAIRLSAQTGGIGGETFQIATSKETSVSELAEKLIEIYKDLKGAHHHVEVKYSTPRKGDVKRNYSDTSKALMLLNWQADTLLEDGLAKTISLFGSLD